MTSLHIIYIYTTGNLQYKSFLKKNLLRAQSPKTTLTENRPGGKDLPEKTTRSAPSMRIYVTM